MFEIAMQVGDWVRLKRPFYPLPGHSQAYEYGIVVGLIPDERVQDARGNIIPAEILLKLVDRESRNIYTDKTGARALYSFYPEEIEATETSRRQL